MSGRLRILIVNHFPLEGSGSGTYVRSVAADLVRRGHAVRVIAPDHEPATGYPFEVDTILFRGDGNLARSGEEAAGRLPFNFPCFTTHPRSRATFEQLSDAQLDRYRAAFREAIASAASKFRPDLVHGQHLWIATAIAAETGLPLVATSHGTDLMGLDSDPRGAADARAAARAARLVLAVSTAIAKEVRQRLPIERERVRVVWNGFDPAVFRVVPVDREALLRRHGIPQHYRQIILYMGKLARFKGPDVLLSAAALYESRVEGAVTLIVGEGEMKDDLVAQHSRLGLKHVYFLGHQTIEEAVRMYNAADLAIVPSLGEPFGLVALEALACGTPVVGTRAGGLVDFINDAVGGLVPAGEPEALAARITQEIRLESKRRKGPEAAQYALASFSWPVQVGKIEAAYREVVS